MCKGVPMPQAGQYLIINGMPVQLLQHPGPAEQLTGPPLGSLAGPTLQAGGIKMEPLDHAGQQLRMAQTGQLGFHQAASPMATHFSGALHSDSSAKTQAALDFRPSVQGYLGEGFAGTVRKRPSEEPLSDAEDALENHMASARERNRQAQRRFRARQKVLIASLRAELDRMLEQAQQYERTINALRQENLVLHAKLGTVPSNITLATQVPVPPPDVDLTVGGVTMQTLQQPGSMQAPAYQLQAPAPGAVTYITQPACLPSQGQPTQQQIHIITLDASNSVQVSNGQADMQRIHISMANAPDMQASTGGQPLHAQQLQTLGSQQVQVITGQQLQANNSQQFTLPAGQQFIMQGTGTQYTIPPSDQAASLAASQQRRSQSDEQQVVTSASTQQVFTSGTQPMLVNGASLCSGLTATASTTPQQHDNTPVGDDAHQPFTTLNNTTVTYQF